MNEMNVPILQSGLLDTFMPMHLVYDGKGTILHVGPTLAKMQGTVPMVGSTLESVFAVRDDGRGVGEGPIPLKSKLYITFHSGMSTPLKGMAMPVEGTDLNILNLSFGISIVDAVADYRFTSGDFAHTDLAIEMLYLVEAKSAVLEETKQLNARLQNAKAAAEEQAFTDTLTGLKNRRAMDQMLSRMLRSHIPFALMHLDLDYFKSVNDTLGHAAGDAVLQRVAQVLNEETREGDGIARVGGDEFILIFARMTDHARLLTTAARLISRLEVPIPFQDAFCRISGSIGITTTDFYTEPNADAMMHDADLALYSSKHEGRGRPTLFDPTHHYTSLEETPEVAARR